jgi:hypothetical protein
VYGVYITISAGQAEAMRGLVANSNSPNKAEVMLEYDGVRRSCSLDELVAFMKGENLNRRRQRGTVTAVEYSNAMQVLLPELMPRTTVRIIGL